VVALHVQVSATGDCWLHIMGATLEKTEVQQFNVCDVICYGEVRRTEK
jgi:hypothetical protein